MEIPRFYELLRKQFTYNGISMFDDQEIERSEIIGLALKQAIRESKISIVVLSKNYASSSWCLDELLEILECGKHPKQIVIPVFYGVDPSDVRKQSGNFGKAFNITCRRKTKEDMLKWRKALNHVADIAGEHVRNWDNESKMIEKIARDVSNKLNATISWDFEDIVGIEAHLQKMQSLLHLNNDHEAMIVGISGPAGIGKTTIARALHSRFSISFQLTCFMESVSGSYNCGLDEYGWKLYLQEQLLSKILNQNDMRIYDLSAIRNRLSDRKVLIIIDDVDDLRQLEALANESNWFGPGSRIIVTTEDQELLEKHNINHTYQVDFPTKYEAYKIFCRYAFRQKLASHGFKKLAERITELCSNLPLGLRVMGSTLRGKKEDDWEDILHRLENGLHPKIDGVLRVGYDHLHKDDQYLFLLIAFFFNYMKDINVKAMLVDTNMNVRLGLKTLGYKSLIRISTNGKIVMHKLLQQVAREVVQRQELGKQQILIHADEIIDVLNNNSRSTNTVTGISLDMTTVPNGECINAGAFKRLKNLRFLDIYHTRLETNDKVHVPEDMDFPPRMRLLRWDLYPGKCFPRTFCTDYLVRLDLPWNKLEKLWEGTQMLPNLKTMDLYASMNLKELPDLSNATNLEKLVLRCCTSLVEIPSSIGNLHKLKVLDMNYCTKVQNVPTHFNLASLETLHMVGCWQLRRITDISANVTWLAVADTMLKELPTLSSRLETLFIFGNRSTKISQFRGVGAEINILTLEKRVADIEKIPDWIKDLHSLKWLYIIECPKLASLPKLPGSLRGLIVDNCRSLETISFYFDTPVQVLYFINCFKLGQEAIRVITNQSLHTCIPGRNIPVGFVHRAIGNSLTIRSSFLQFRFCVVLFPKQNIEADPKFWCRICINGCPIDRYIKMSFGKIGVEHLFMSFIDFHDKYRLLEQDNEVSFEFNTTSPNIHIIECGVQILTQKTNTSLKSQGMYESRHEFDHLRRSKLISTHFYLFSLLIFISVVLKSIFS